MYTKVSRRSKGFFSRCLKPFKEHESLGVKECGNCCCNLQWITSLTGFSKAAKSKRCRRMTIKPFVFLLCSSGFFYQTWVFLQMYLAYPIILDIHEEFPDSFSAPAITICNKNRLLRQKYCKAYPELCTWKHTTWETFCNEYSRMCPETEPPDFNFGIPIFRGHKNQNGSTAFLHALTSESENSTLSYCGRFSKNTIVHCKKSLITIQVPGNGLPYKCFTVFFRHEGLHEEQLNLTLTDGFLMDLKMNPEDYFNTIEPVKASIVLHDPRRYVNPISDGITLTAGKFYRIFATMERRERLPPPYASKCIDYLIQWKKNGGYGPLSKYECIQDCTNSAMMEKYGCTGQSMTYPSGYDICGSLNEDATSEMVRRCAKGCRKACEEHSYHITSHTLLNSDLECNLTDKYCKSRYIFLAISFNRMKVKIFKYRPRIESIELFSYIGGYLGIWLGISLSSAFDLGETIYGVIDYAVLKRKKNQKEATPIQQFRNHIVIV